jgi:hypothetical protein
VIAMLTGPALPGLLIGAFFVLVILAAGAVAYVKRRIDP